MLSVFNYEEDLIGRDNVYELDNKYIDLCKENNYFAMVEPIYPQLCKIEKISTKSLVITYFNEDSIIPENGILDLLKINNGFSNQKISFTKIYDNVVNESLYYELRECKLSFKNLTSKQSESIDNYIRNIGNLSELNECLKEK